jgi:UDP-glucose 4-epimerase
VNYQQLTVARPWRITRDFIFIDDLIEAIMLAYAKENIGGEVFQIATNAETTVNKMANQLVKIMDRRGIENINVLHSEPRLGDVFRNYSDTSKATEVLGWNVYTDLEYGLKKTIDWFLDKCV